MQQIKRSKLGEFARGIFYRVLSRIHIGEYDLNALYCAKCLPRCSGFTYDCVIAYQVLSPSVIATALYRLNGKKKILWVHGRNVRPRKLNRYFDRVYAKFDYIACVSETTRQEFGHDFPKAMKKTHTLYNLFDAGAIENKAVSLIDLEMEHTSLATVGRLVSIKGQQMIPRTTRLLLDAGYDIHWYLVGDGPLRETVEAEIQKYGVADRVILLGTQMNPYPYIKNCDIYVQPSFSEGYCTTTMEAKVLGCPVLATDVSGIREQLVHGETGWIVDNDTDAIYEGLKHLLLHPEVRERLRSNEGMQRICSNEEKYRKFMEICGG